MITSIILSYIWWLIIPALIGGAIACYIYVPIIGKFMAICLCSGSAAIASYELGYADRGKLDHSVELQAQIKTLNIDLAQAKLDARNTKEVADASSERQAQAEKVASDLQAQVADYEQQLKDAADNAGQPDIQIVHEKDATCPTIKSSSSCFLSNSDVIGLRRIGRPRPVAK